MSQSWKFLNMIDFRQHSGGSVEVMSELAHLFLTSFDERWHLLKTAAVSKNFQKLEQTAHSFKTSLRILGAAALADCAETLENHAHQQSASEIQVLLSTWETQMCEFRAEVSRFHKQLVLETKQEGESLCQTLKRSS